MHSQQVNNITPEEESAHNMTNLVQDLLSSINSSDDSPVDLSNITSVQLGDDDDAEEITEDDSGSNSDEQRPNDFGDLPSFIQQNLADLMQEATTQNENPFQMQVCFGADDVKQLYTLQEHPPRPGDDVGWDLHCTEDVILEPNQTHMLDFGVSVSCTTDCGVTPVPLLLMPRSSISKTPLRLANSIGLIDPNYRGNIKAAVDHRGSDPYTIKKGDRLFQLVAMPSKAMKWSVVDSLNETERGDCGFGSTGR